jgi:excisionase family DNA binding protein
MKLLIAHHMYKFLSKKEAAKQLSVSVRQLDRYIKDGRVKAFKPYNGMRVLIHSDSLTEENLKSPVPVFRTF